MLFQNITLLDRDLCVREAMYVGTRNDRILYIASLTQRSRSKRVKF